MSGNNEVFDITAEIILNILIAAMLTVKKKAETNKICYQELKNNVAFSEIHNHFISCCLDSSALTHAACMY